VLIDGGDSVVGRQVLERTPHEGRGRISELIPGLFLANCSGEGPADVT
jgi:hypothetical protein